jgi:uncharacterized protein YdhG (YjbR/CyaY superfamily)
VRREYKMAIKPTVTSVDEYIARFPPETQKVLEELRALIKSTAPGVTEKISYGIPTFDLNGHYLVYFACWKKHLGFYPVTDGVVKTFKEELGAYKSGKGSLQFPLGQSVPTDLIRRIIKFRVEEVAGKHKSVASGE